MIQKLMNGPGSILKKERFKSFQAQAQWEIHRMHNNCGQRKPKRCSTMLIPTTFIGFSATLNQYLVLQNLDLLLCCLQMVPHWSRTRLASINDGERRLQPAPKSTIISWTVSSWPGPSEANSQGTRQLLHLWMKSELPFSRWIVARLLARMEYLQNCTGHWVRSHSKLSMRSWPVSGKRKKCLLISVIPW